MKISIGKTFLNSQVKNWKNTRTEFLFLMYLLQDTTGLINLIGKLGRNSRPKNKIPSIDKMLNNSDKRSGHYQCGSVKKILKGLEKLLRKLYCQRK